MTPGKSNSAPDKNAHGQQDERLDAFPVLRVLSWVWPHTVGQRVTIGLLFGLNAALGVGNAGMIHAMKALVDGIASRCDQATLVKRVAFYAGVALSTSLLRTLYARWRKLVLQRVKTRLRCELYAKYSSLPGEYLHTRDSGTFCHQMNHEVGKVATAIQTVFEATDTGILIVSLVTAALVISPVITLATLMVLPLTRLIGFSHLKRVRDVQSEMNKRSAVVDQMLIETLRMMRIIRVYQAEATFGRQFASRVSGIDRIEYQNTVEADHFFFKKQVVMYSFVALIYYWFGLHSIEGAATAGSFVAFTSILSGLTNYFELFFYLQTTFHQLHGAGAEVFSIMGMDTSGMDRGTREIEGEIREIRFEDVSFAFPLSRRPILEHANLVIRKGETAVLMGRSGAGKSTLLNLLIRMYEPLAGRILINGVDIREYKLSSLRKHLSLVGQEIGLFSDTILENIRLGRPSASLEEVKAAARAANADSFIASLPRAYDSLVGDDGKHLSQGQKQRIAIARAILKGGSILLLDEPTAGLDEESMQVLQEALMRPNVTRTSIVVLHDAASIPKGARVVRLENRKLVEITEMPALQDAG